MKKQRYSSGRSFLGTLFLIAVGFAIGFYFSEILSLIQNTVQSISY